MWSEHRAQNYDPEEISYTPSPLRIYNVFHESQQDEVIKNHD